MSTLQIMFLNAKTGSRGAWWPSAMGAAKAMWPWKMTELQLHESTNPRQPHLGKTHRSISQEHDAWLISFFWDLICSSSFLLPFHSLVLYTSTFFTICNSNVRLVPYLKEHTSFLPTFFTFPSLFSFPSWGFSLFQFHLFYTRNHFSEPS